MAGGNKNETWGFFRTPGTRMITDNEKAFAIREAIRQGLIPADTPIPVASSASPTESEEK